MSPGASIGGQTHPTSFMYVVGGIILAGLALYYLFIAIDGWGLEQRHAAATVQGKEYRQGGLTYATQRIGDRMMTLPQRKADAYVLKLSIEGREAWAVVGKDLYQATQEGDPVDVVYEVGRVLGRTRVMSVTRR